MTAFWSCGFTIPATSRKLFQSDHHDLAAIFLVTMRIIANAACTVLLSELRDLIETSLFISMRLIVLLSELFDHLPFFMILIWAFACPYHLHKPKRCESLDS